MSHLKPEGNEIHCAATIPSARSRTGSIKACLLARDILMTSCFSRYIDTASRTKSFIRNGTRPAIAGNPAAGSHPFGMKGMMVRVVKKVMVEPMAPRSPNLLSQNPAYRRARIVHSDAPKNRAPPRSPKAGYSQESKGLLLINGIIACAPYWCHFV